MAGKHLGANADNIMWKMVNIYVHYTQMPFSTLKALFNSCGVREQLPGRFETVWDTNAPPRRVRQSRTGMWRIDACASVIITHCTRVMLPALIREGGRDVIDIGFYANVAFVNVQHDTICIVIQSVPFISALIQRSSP